MTLKVVIQAEPTIYAELSVTPHVEWNGYYLEIIKDKELKKSVTNITPGVI